MERRKIEIAGNRSIAAVATSLSTTRPGFFSFFRILVRDTIQEIMGTRALSCDLEDDDAAGYYYLLDLEHRLVKMMLSVNVPELRN